MQHQGATPRGDLSSIAADPLADTVPRLHVAAKDALIDLSIVLVNWNGKALLEQCLQSLFAIPMQCRYEVIVVDNNSTDGSQGVMQTWQQTGKIQCIFNTDNPGFGVGNNRALPTCQGRYILFLNTDTLVLEPLDALVAEADRLGERCSMVGGRVLNPDRTIQFTCRGPYTVPVMAAAVTLVAFTGMQPPWIRRQQMTTWDHATARDVAWLSGCYMLVPRRVLAELGGFDPQIFMYYEDTELCARIKRAGYIVRYAPVSAIIHLGGGSTTKAAQGLNVKLLSSELQSARYFARTYLGRGSERRLVAAVWLCWFALWCVFAPAALLVPLPPLRRKLGQRSRHLSALLRGLRRDMVVASS